MGALGVTAPAVAQEDEEHEASEEETEAEEEAEPEEEAEAEEEVDEPVDFAASRLMEPAFFPDEVATQFSVVFAQGDEFDPVTTDLADPSTAVFLEMEWGPGGTTGWHTQQGPAFIAVAEGSLEVVSGRDCVIRTYTAGEALFDPGEVNSKSNPSGDETTRAYGLFLDVPDGEPALLRAEPVVC